MRHLPIFFLLSATLLPLAAQSFSIQSGDGQIVLENFRATAPMRIRGLDPLGRPLVGARIDWAVTSGAGELLEVVSTTDADGAAQAFFRATVVPGGNSVQQSTVVARTPFGEVRFRVTTALVSFNGTLASPPIVQLISPALDAPVPTGPTGSTLTGAVVVRVGVGGGPDVGQPLPNVGIRVLQSGDVAQGPSAVCRGTNGTILTDDQGLAVCDLVLNNRVGLARLAMNVGEFVTTRDFLVNITAGTPCSFSIQPPTKLLGSGGGRDSFTLSATGTSCGWTAQSTVSWLSIVGGSSGTGPAEIFFSAESNPSVNQRIGTITVAGQVLTVNQAGTGSSGVLTITSPTNLPNVVAGQPSSYSLQAQGGRPPYRWSVGTSLPSGFNLSVDGILSGLTQAAGTTTFNVNVIDANGTLASKTFQLTVLPVDTNQNPSFLTTAFPGAVLAQPYRQPIDVRIGCANLVSSTLRMERTAGSLPAGLDLVQAGAQWVIQGTPTEAGRVSSFTLRATNPCGFTATADFSIAVSGQGTPPPPTTGGLSSVPTALTFEVFQGRSTVVPQQRVSVRFANPVTYVAAPVSGWINIVSGNPGVTNTTEIVVSVANYEAFAPGQYTGSILVSSIGLAPLSIPVTLNVVPPPALFVSPTELNFSVPIAIAPVPPGTIRQSLSVGGSIGVGFIATAQTSTGANWLRVTPTSSTSPAILDVEINHVGLQAGNYSGRVSIGFGGIVLATIPVNLTVNNPPQLTWNTTGLSFALTPGDSTLRPQTVSLTTSSSTPARVAITTNTLSGGNWLRIDQTSGTTPMNIVVSVDTTGLGAGQYNGEILARAVDGSSLATSGVRVVLLVTETTPTILAVVNAASELPGPVTPGGWAAVRGTFLGSTGTPTPYRAVNGRVETQVSDVRILVDGLPAPILSASSQRTVFQVPYSAADRQRISVVAEFRGNRSQPVEVPVVFVNPAIFVIDGAQGDIRNEDGSFNSATRGAVPGETVTLFATGEGPTDPAGVDGLIIGNENIPRPTILPVQLWMDGQEAEIVSAGAVPGMPAGLFQVRAKVPATVTRGASVPVTLGINGNYSPDPVTIAIRP